MTAPRCLIVGAGIGGLTAAIALRRRGVDAVIFEQAPELGNIQVGTGIHLWPNAMNALRWIDLFEQMRAVGTEVERARFLEYRGGFLSEMGVGESGRHVGSITIGARRSAVHAVLADALEPDSIRLGSECVGFEQDGDGVTLRLADGREERGDLLVGADGLRSVVRARLLSDGGPRYASSSWLGLLEFERDDAPHDALNVVWGPGKGFIFFHAGGNTLSWIGNVIADESATTPAAGDRKAAVLPQFEGWAEPVPTIIESTDDDRLLLMHIFDRPPTESWGEGRVTLLGDAAHPMIPTITQGACQAIEDGVVLAKCVAEADDTPTALRDYERLRIPRTSKLQKTARRLAAIGSWDSPLACAARNQFFKRFSGFAERQEEREVFAHQV